MCAADLSAEARFVIMCAADLSAEARFVIIRAKADGSMREPS
jgi:hypothetical protein